MLDVCLLGTGGTMPLPRRWLTALVTRFNGHSLLIDCGEGTQIAMKEAGISPNPIDVICFTHYHADHISGLPGLLLSMGNADRTDPVTLIGPRGLVRVVTALRSIAQELPFEVRMVEIEDRTQEFARRGIKLTYCTDSRPTPAISDAAAGADLFICEGMYGDPEDAGKARKKKHMTFAEAAALAREAKAEELWLTHFSPSLVGAARYMDQVTEIFPNASLGWDGRSCTLDFPEE